MPHPASSSDEMIVKGKKKKKDFIALPETIASTQVPFSSTLPSGHVHLAPVGLRRHINSQDILKHGFDAVERK